MLETLTGMKLEAELWCEGRSPWARLLLLGYLAYAGVRHLIDPMYRSWFAGITLAFHELGHILFSGLGNTMMLLGGSIMQVLVPAAAAIYLLLRQGDFFGFSVGASWFSFALWEMATYIRDAAREQLPLVGFGDHPQHDWGTLLTQWGILNSCDTIATGVRVIATATWGASMVLGAWLCWTIWRAD
jgi:hypothetical protein